VKIQSRLAALLAGVAIVAAACGTGTATNAPSTGPGATATPAPVVTPMPIAGKIVIWHSYGSSGGGADSAEVQALNKILAAMKVKFPDLTIESINVAFSALYKDFEAESGAGGGPDMFIAPNDNLGAESRDGYLADLTGLIDDTLAASSPVSGSGSMVAGKVYMVPESLKAVAMYYDSKKVATPPATMADLLAYVKAGGKVGVIDGAYFGWGFYSAFGGSIFDANGKCAATATKGVADAIDFVKQLKAAGAMVDSNYGNINNAFISGKIDIMFNGNWALGDYKKARPGLAVGPMPAGPSGVAKTMAGVDGWYINPSGKHIDLAIAVAKEMVAVANEQFMVDIAGHVPANTAAVVTDPLVKGFAAAILAGDPRPQTPEFNNYWGAFGDAWTKAIPDDGSAGGDITALVAGACTAMDTANKK